MGNRTYLRRACRRPYQLSVSQLSSTREAPISTLSLAALHRTPVAERRDRAPVPRAGERHDTIPPFGEWSFGFAPSGEAGGAPAIPQDRGNFDGDGALP